MADLSTTYLGLTLRNPLVVSSSPLAANVENIRQMERAEAAAVVLPSLFEEQIELRDMGVDNVDTADKKMLPDALRHIPEMKEYNQGASGYLSYIYQTKKAVSIPIIASLNGYYSGGWVQYARLIEAAGADALELNIYHLATKPHISSQEVELMYLNLVRNVKGKINIPVAVKISPFFSALSHTAVQLDKAGANGLVLFNRFYQPDIDIENEWVVPSLDLSDPAELRLRLRWVAILGQYVQADLAVTGGVHSGTAILKSILAGASVAMTTSALMENGIDHLQTMLAELNDWLDAHGVKALRSLQGRMSQQNVADPAAFERANYMSALKNSDIG
ncbi:MAG: dihydroorotate dehydrogenase-like protein [Chloroflexi bacterium]|nr:dihydroorotate dehydrogenase-like protein [Chloroflexota bacterium]